MADDNEIEEQSEEEFEEGAEQSGARKPKLRLIIILTIVLTLVAGGAAFYFMKGVAPEGKVAAAAEEGDAGPEEEVLDTPYYFSLDPPFVVNFTGKSRAKFLQVNISGLTRNPAIKEDITTHLPHIRNNIVFILSSKRYDELLTQEGKEDLRKQVLAEVRKILKKETGNGEVEDIYFTSFVMQ